MALIITRPKLPDELAPPEPTVVIIEEGPAINTCEVQRWNGQRITVSSHVTKQRHIGSAAITFSAAAIHSISIIVRAAARVPIILGTIHEDAILALGFGHRGE